jgi:hypothetical protein
MAAPTNAAKRKKSPCQPGAVHTWHKTDVPTALRNVRYEGQSGKHVLALSFSIGFRAARVPRCIILGQNRNHGLS